MRGKTDNIQEDSQQAGFHEGRHKRIFGSAKMPKRNRGFFLEWRKERSVWEIVWYVRGKKKRLSTGTEDRIAADRHLTQHKERSGKRERTRLVDDALNAYLEEHAPHTARPKDIAYCVLNLAPFFGELSVDEVTKAKCQEYSRERKGVANATIRKDLEILRAALNHDHAEGRCEKNFYVWMPDKPEARQRWLTRQEAAKLIRAARKVCDGMRDKDGEMVMWHLPWFILLSLYSGQRKEAVLSLTWDRVDLERGKINWQYGKKTNKRRPMQPMPDALWLFMRYLRLKTSGEYVLSYRGARIARVTRSLATALKLAGIEGVTTHTLKHTAITWMMQAGTDIWAVAGFTGTSLKTIESTYGHHAPEYLEEARNSSKAGRARRHAQKQAQENENKLDDSTNASKIRMEMVGAEGLEPPTLSV